MKASAPGMTRRRALGLLSTSALAAWCAPAFSAAPGRAARRMGVGMHSYGHHWTAARQQHAGARFHDALSFLSYCRDLGAGGVQVAIGVQEPAYTRKLRSSAEQWNMYLEAQSTLPPDASDVSRFEREVRTAREAGAAIMRTACLSSRRYETFSSAEDFRRFTEASLQSLRLAEPVLRRHQVRLAVENHKDWRVPELLDLLRHLSSEWIGVTLDTGNSIALMEDGHEVVEALAPFALTTHLKDMAVLECEDGFLLSEVPLGQGCLDLPRIVALCEKANPRIQFNLEMITRDPLRVPCLTEKYWAALSSVRAQELARTLALVRDRSSGKPLPAVTGKSFEQRLAYEDENVRASFACARSTLGLA